MEEKYKKLYKSNDKKFKVSSMSYYFMAEYEFKY